MWYTYRRDTRGDEYSPVDGHRPAVALEPRRLYRLEPVTVTNDGVVIEPYEGRLTTGYGYIPRILRVLQAAGHQVHWIDVGPPRERPNCYVPDWERARANYTARDQSQWDCLAVIADSWGGVINAPMGFGKTKLFDAICWLFSQARIAIVVKSRDVADKIVRRLSRVFPNVGYVTGGQKRQGSRITVFTAGCLRHCDGNYDILLCDEAHQLMSPKISEDLPRAFPFTRNFAFTGTPEGRFDGADAKLEMFFGPEIFTMLYPDAVQRGLVVPIHVRWIPIHLDRNPVLTRSGTARNRWGIWRNQQRNWLIAQDIRKNVGKDDQVLCAVATVDHAIHLWQYLPDFTLCYSDLEDPRFDGYVKNRMVPSIFQRMTPQLRDRLRSQFEVGELKRVIATDVWSTGVDFEPLQKLYRCDGRASEILDSQWPGRTSRIFDGKSCGEVIDCCDLFDDTLKRRSQTRKRHYKAHGWSQDWPRGRRQISYV
jgi:superfamily II DNA or RNA helicase